MMISRPRAIFIASFILFIVVAWISLAVVDFADTVTLSGFRTGGWFVLGFPFVLGGAFAYASFFMFIARRGNWIVSVGALLVASSLLTYTGAASMFPSSRLSTIIGSHYVSKITVKRFRTIDSFNDGTTCFGVLSVPRDVMRQIVKDRQLNESGLSSLHFLSPVVDDAAIPEEGQVLRNDRTRAYYDQPTETMYFCDHFEGSS